MKKIISLFFSLLAIQYCWAEEFTSSDFTYSSDSKLVTGFSTTGVKKLSTNPDVTLPSNSVLRGVNANAFKGNSKIKSIVIPEDYIVIGSGAFADCTSLEEVTIPSTISQINTKADDGGLRSNAFSGCSNLQKVRLNCSYVVAGKINTYNSTFNLRTVFPNASTFVLGSGVKKIANYAFYEISSTPLYIRTSANTEIGDFAFYGNDTVDINDYSPSKIGRYAFGNNTLNAKADVIFDKNVQSIGENAFSNCASIHTSINSSVHGKWHLEGCTSVGSNAFCPDAGGSTVELYLGADTIATNAFARVNVTTVHLSGASLLGQKFTETANLSTFFPNATVYYLNAEKIGKNALYNNEKVTTVYLESNVETIGEYAFCNCTKLKTVTDKTKNLHTIGLGAFSFCAALETVTFYNVTSMKKGCFLGCANLKNATIPNLITVPNNCFENDKNLVYISAAAAKNIGQYAFKNCIKFENYNNSNQYSFPNLEYIYDSAFENCTELTASPFFNSTNLKGIGIRAFYGCKNIGHSFYFLGSPEDGITRTPLIVNDSAFMGTNIKTAILPSSMTYLGKDVLQNLESLTVDSEWLLSDNGSIFDKVTLKNDGNTVLKVGGTEGSYDIGANKFKSSQMLNLKYLEIGDNIGNINEYGFYNTTADSIKIGKNADFNCEVSKIQMNCNERLTVNSEKIFQANSLKKFTEESNLFGVFGKKLKVINTKFSSLSRCDDYAFYTPTSESSALEEVNGYWFIIGKYAFHGNSKLEYKGLENVLKISDFAFYGCNNHIFISADHILGVGIGERAFAKNPICVIEINSQYSDVASNAFEECNPAMVYDASDNVFMEDCKSDVKMITRTEERATLLRNSENKYSYSISAKRMGCSVEDVNMDSSLSGEDVQKIYNAMK